MLVLNTVNVKDFTPQSAPNPSCCSDPRTMCSNCARQALGVGSDPLTRNERPAPFVPADINEIFRNELNDSPTEQQVQNGSQSRPKHLIPASPW